LSALAKEVERRISDLTTAEHTRKARLYDLADLKKRELSTLNSLKQAKDFLVCWIFFAASFAYALFSYLPWQRHA
jgi:hypothetical protein